MAMIDYQCTTRVKHIEMGQPHDTSRWRQHLSACGRGVIYSIVGVFRHSVIDSLTAIDAGDWPI